MRAAALVLTLSGCPEPPRAEHGDELGDGTDTGTECITSPAPEAPGDCEIEMIWGGVCPGPRTDYCDCGCLAEGSCPVGPQIHDILRSFEDNGCAECHDGGPGSTNLDLTHDAAWSNLVNRNALESGLLRVVPGSLGESWLWHKLRGSQECPAALPNEGLVANDPMPFSGGALPPEVLANIELWICCGAHDG